MTAISLMSILLTGNPALRLEISLKPRVWVEKTQVTLTVTAVNTSDKPVVLLSGNTADDNLFFSLHLKNESGKDIRTGLEGRFMQIDDLPLPVSQSLAPGASRTSELEWRFLHDLKPGKYALSVIYRVQPEDKSDIVRYYVEDVKKQHAFTGLIESESVQFTVEPRK